MSDALRDQTVVVVGGSAGIGLETARLARAEGAAVILGARNPERLQRAADDIGAMSTAAFDATDEAALDRFFANLPETFDHVMVTAGRPYYGPLAEMDVAAVRRSFDDHYWLALHIARLSVGRVRPGGTPLFMSGTGGRRIVVGYSIISSATAAMPALIASLAVEIAPIRVNLIAPGFVVPRCPHRSWETSSNNGASSLRATLPIGRVVGPEDVAALAVHLMTNTALTGATYDIDGGQHLVS